MSTPSTISALPAAGSVQEPGQVSAAMGSVASGLVGLITEVTRHTVSEMVASGELATSSSARTIIVRERGATVEIDDPVPAVFDKVLALAGQRMNILLVGPAGCGKTHLAGLVAKALNLPFSSLSLNQGTPPSSVTGWLLPIGESGRFQYVPSGFVTAYEQGGVFLLDEIDNGDPNTLGIFNQALANNVWHCPQRFEAPEVRRHPDFICVAAANTWGTGADNIYVGRNQLDMATLDRFAMGRVEMTYDPKVEETLVDPKVLAWGRTVRAAIEKHQLRRIVSTRFLRDASVMFRSNGWRRAVLEEQLFAGWSRAEIDRVRAALSENS